ncbi:hypothetical protein AAG570_003102 [Ranatra chinensis]|uniref:Asteroid domain-containing protein n=1 Tax=Ranatra chinensis TaxID=642074 RepID=A0ABD0Y5V8_9HEMI
MRFTSFPEGGQETMSTVRDCPVIVCDGLSTVNFIYSGLDYIHGGQLKEFGQAVADFVQKFEEYGARLVFFFDGTLMPVKNATWIKRRSNELYDAIDLLDQLESGNLTASSLGPNRMICLPIGIREVFFYVLRYVCKCEFRIAVKDCDEEIARYAKNMNCFAILSQDTDFVIYDSASYNRHRHSDMNYDSDSTAEDGDWTKPVRINALSRDFHLRLLDTRPGYRPNFYYLPEKIASFIRRSNVKNLQAIAYRIFGNRAYTSLIRDSIYSYDLTIEDVDATSVDDKTGWSRILARAKELCISSNLSSSIYQILAFSIIYAGSNYEDYRKKDLPLTREVLSNLRRKIYGILLYEKPLTDGERCHYVEELVAGSPDSLCPGMKVEPLMPSEGEHPGLLELWDGVGKEAEDRRWNLIGEVLKLNKVQLETLRELEPRLIKVVITLVYVIVRIMKFGCY